MAVGLAISPASAAAAELPGGSALVDALLRGLNSRLAGGRVGLRGTDSRTLRGHFRFSLYRFEPGDYLLADREPAR